MTKIEFIHSDPRNKSLAIFNSVLAFGESKLAMAVAFCTKSGVSVLRNHVARLKKEGSFVVVSYNKPTDYYALAEIHKKAPDSVFVHYGAASPYEINFGNPLMHSKVVYAEKGNDAQLWVGSHNLTGNAMLGLNYEAALLIKGDKHEQYFLDALTHLEACKQDSILYDPDNSDGITDPGGEDVLVIHAECEKIPDSNFSWTIQLLLNTSQYDYLFSMPAQVRLYLYSNGELSKGIDNAVPLKKYTGTLTGKNLTKKNETTGLRGTQASWSEAKFEITQDKRFLTLTEVKNNLEKIKTQVVFTVDQELVFDEVYLSSAPKVGPNLVFGDESFIETESDMFKHYKPSDVVVTKLRYKPLIKKGYKFAVNSFEVSDQQLPELKNRLQNLKAREVVREPSKNRSKLPQHPFIKRAKYII